MGIRLKPQGESMGLTHIAVQLRSSGSKNAYSANFVVDTGATDSMVPASELKRIGIEPVGKKTYELASGELVEYEIAFAEFAFMGDIIVSRVIFGPDNGEPILGVIALELVGVVVDPLSQKLKKLPALPLKRVA
jgi:clan AA aspartic protease